MRGAMQKVLGRVRRLSTSAPYRKPQDAPMPQPPLPPFVLGPPKFDNWMDSVLLQYGRPDDTRSPEDDYIIIAPDHLHLKEADIPTKAEAFETMYQGLAQDTGHTLRRSRKSAPVDRADLTRAATHSGISRDFQLDLICGSILSASDTVSKLDHFDQATAAYGATHSPALRSARQPSIGSQDTLEDVDETPTPAATSMLPSVSTRRIIVGRAPRPDLNKPLPEPPRDESSSEGDGPPGAIPDDEESVASSGFNTPLSLQLDSDIELEPRSRAADEHRPGIESDANQRSGNRDHIQSDLQSDPPHGDDHMELLERTQTSEVPEVVLASGGIGPGTGDLPEAPGLSAPSTSIEDALRSAISKGKGRAAPEDETPRINPAVIHQLENLEIWPSGSICGICGEGFRKTYNPLEASLSASGSSDPVLYGLSLTCPGKHEYCLSCMTSYVRIKLEGESGTIFPIRCPECPRDVTWELYDEMAMVLLGKDLLDAWFFQRLLASLPVFYCPNPKCSAPISEDVDDPDLTQVECPSCRVEMCFHCRTLWHPDVSCEYNQNPKALEGEMLLKQLAEQLQWRRCPRCRHLVERTAGCRHMTCRCGFQYCHFCGSPWRNGVCSRSGDCSNWVADKTWKLGEKVEPVDTLFSPGSSRSSRRSFDFPMVPQEPIPLTPPERHPPWHHTRESLVDDWVSDQGGRLPARTDTDAESVDASNAPLVQPIPLPSPRDNGTTIVYSPDGQNAITVIHPPGEIESGHLGRLLASHLETRSPSSPPVVMDPGFTYSNSAKQGSMYIPPTAEDEYRRRYPSHGFVCGTMDLQPLSERTFIHPAVEDERRRRREASDSHLVHTRPMMRLGFPPHDPVPPTDAYPTIHHNTGCSAAEDGHAYGRHHQGRPNHPAFHLTRRPSIPPAPPLPPTTESSTQRPRPISTAQLETELTKSYSRQHRERRVYADQQRMDSAYRPVEVPVLPRLPRPTRRSDRIPAILVVDRSQPGPNSPSEPTEYPLPYWADRHPPYWTDHLPAGPRSQEDWNRDAPVTGIPALDVYERHDDNGQGRQDREEAGRKSNATIHYVRGPTQGPGPFERVVWEQYAVPSLPGPVHQSAAYLVEQQSTGFIPRADIYRTGQDSSVRGSRDRIRGNTEVSDTAGKGEGGGRKRRLGRPPLSKSARHVQSSTRDRPARSSSSSSRQDPPKSTSQQSQQSQHARAASATSNSANNGQPAEPPNTAPVQRGRSLRERLTYLVNRTPSQDAVWRLERERGLVEGPASATLGRAFSRQYGYEDRDRERYASSVANHASMADQRTPFSKMLRGANGAEDRRDG